MARIHCGRFVSAKLLPVSFAPGQSNAMSSQHVCRVPETRKADACRKQREKDDIGAKEVGSLCEAL